MSEDREVRVAKHYGGGALEQRVLEALERSGLDLKPLSPKDLAPIDEFHMGGRKSTADILGRLGLTANDKVLDIGCGLGGVLRYLASEFGCQATGIDLTPEFISLAQRLTEMTRLSDKVSCQVASALDLPFPSETFDAATTFHVAMNIADRKGLYSEAARVLKPAGTFALFDVTKGKKPGMRFPTPWAEEEAVSHLVSPGEMGKLLKEAGFETTFEEDRTHLITDHHRARLKEQESQGEKPPALLGLHLLQGESAKQKSQNMLEMAKADQIRLTVMIARKGT